MVGFGPRRQILVTGGAGYIGSHLVDQLILSGNRVTVIDDLSTGSHDNINHLTGNSQFEFIHGTILDEPLMDTLVARSESIFHLAAVVGVKHVVQNPLQCVEVNVHGTEIVLRKAHQYKKRVLLASSSEIYGKSAAYSFQEEGERVLGPTWVHRWSYATAKALDEHLAFAYFDKGLPVSIVRYFNSYGPHSSETGYGSVIAQFIRQALLGEPITVHGDGSQKRCFTFVADTVRGTILAGEKPEALGQAFNIGNRNEEISILRLAQMVKELAHSTSPIVHIPHSEYYGNGYEDAPRRMPSIEKSEKILGFHASTNLNEGLAITLDWWKNKTFGKTNILTMENRI